MNQFDQAYAEAARDLLQVSRTHETKVFIRASIDFIASLLALSMPPADISKTMDDLYESYLYFLEASRERPNPPGPLPPDPLPS